MPKRPLAAWWRSALHPLESSRRRLWWTTFLLVTAVAGLWSLANPLFAAPDENSHVIRAIALDHGELTGDEQEARLRPLLDVTPEALKVRVPAIYVNEDSACFAFQPNTTAQCAHVEGSTRDVDALTTAGRHPPSYYAVVGVASWVWRPGPGVVYLMRFLSVLMSAAFIATALTALRRTTVPRVAAIGVLFAVTPMVLFVGSSVNPNGPEIAASIAVWVCGLVLVSQASERIDNRLVTATGIAGCVVALSRQLGPLWLAIIGVTIAVFGSWDAVQALARSGRARIWAALISVSCVAQIGWNVVVGSLGYTRYPNAAKNIPTSEIARFTVGSLFDRYKGLIGYFGWLDTPSPALTYVLWTAGVGFVVLAALAWARQRQANSLLVVIGATVVVPLVLESAVYGDAGGPAWQGRYALPLAVGVPIVAAMAIASSELGPQLAEPRLFVGAGAVLVVAHILAFAQNLRRYTVGYDGEIQYWTNPEWSPPLSPLMVSIAYALLVTAFVAWLLFSAGPSSEGTEEVEERVESAGDVTEPEEARLGSQVRTARGTA
jgi:Predicted membrane protein (DUF2142)